MANYNDRRGIKRIEEKRKSDENKDSISSRKRLRSRWRKRRRKE